MKKAVLLVLGCLVPGGISFTAHGAEGPSALDTSPRAADHAVLRTMLTEATKALNENDFATIEAYLDPNVNIVYQNSTVVDGLAEVRAFQEKMFAGDSAVLTSYSAEVTADKLTEFYGDTAIAYGTIENHFTFTGGVTMNLPSKWTATLIKEEGEWKVVSLALTSNIFDNPLLSAAQASAKYFSIGGLIAGLLLGVLGTILYRRRK